MRAKGKKKRKYKKVLCASVPKKRLVPGHHSRLRAQAMTAQRALPKPAQPQWRLGRDHRAGGQQAETATIENKRLYFFFQFIGQFPLHRTHAEAAAPQAALGFPCEHRRGSVSFPGTRAAPGSVQSVVWDPGGQPEGGRFHLAFVSSSAYSRVGNSKGTQSKSVVG